MQTTINYVDYSFSPWWGCSGKCGYCFARKVAARFGRDFDTLTPVSEATWREPLRWDARCVREIDDWDRVTATHLDPPRRPRVLCGTMCDWLDPEADAARLLGLIGQTPNLDWLVLTKRPEAWRERLEEVSHGSAPDDGAGNCGWLNAGNWLAGLFLPNIWFGVTAETQDTFKHRWTAAVAVPAVKHWLSAEPLLAPIRLYGARPDWVVIGCQSGIVARDSVIADFNRNAFELMCECRREGIPVWVKSAYDKRGRVVSKLEDMPAHEWARTREVPG